jgi:hypothetical protein
MPGGVFFVMVTLLFTPIPHRAILVAPPSALFAAIESLPRTGDFVVLPSSVNKD